MTGWTSYGVTDQGDYARTRVVASRLVNGLIRVGAELLWLRQREAAPSSASSDPGDYRTEGMTLSVAANPPAGAFFPWERVAIGPARIRALLAGIGVSRDLGTRSLCGTRTTRRQREVRRGVAYSWFVSCSVVPDPDVVAILGLPSCDQSYAHRELRGTEGSEDTGHDSSDSVVISPLTSGAPTAL